MENELPATKIEKPLEKKPSVTTPPASKEEINQPRKTNIGMLSQK